MYEKSYGPKYEAGMDIKDIAKLVRKEIKDYFGPNIKYSVTIDRFSGGRALRAYLVDVAPGFYFWKANPDYNPDGGYGIYAERVCMSDGYRKIEEKVKEIIAAYNYDGSDIMVDYFDVNFYSSVGVKFESPAYKKMNAERKYLEALLIEAEIEAANEEAMA
jgi:hypothetical protein